nr:hypothetical protein [Tanacetum cinerariifolium]
QDDDSDSEYDEQVIVVPSFPSNSFAAEADIRKNGISAGSDSAGSMPAGSSSASGFPAGGVPAG